MANSLDVLPDFSNWDDGCNDDVLGDLLSGADGGRRASGLWSSLQSVEEVDEEEMVAAGEFLICK